MKEILTEEETEEIGNLARHHLVLRQQRSYYLKIKGKIENKELPNTMLVVQDFAQMKGENNFVQDLIFVLYYIDPQSKQFLNRVIHVLPPSINTPNDINFVKSAYKLLFTFDLFHQFKDFQIFSDGGPKHFKIAENIRFLHAFRKEHKKTMTYHFFESYHGAGASDGAAAQGISRINNYQRDNNITVKEIEQYAEVLDDITRAEAVILNEVENTESRVAVIQGIKKAYKIDLNDDKQIAFYPSSNSDEPIFFKRVQNDFVLNKNR